MTDDGNFYGAGYRDASELPPTQAERKAKIARLAREARVDRDAGREAGRIIGDAEDRRRGLR